MELVELTEYLVKNLLPSDAEIKINKEEASNETIIQVLVKEEYMSTIIGKGGNIANSIRTIVQAMAYTKKLGRVRINIDSL